MSSKWCETTLGEIAHFDTGHRNSQDAVADGEFPFFICSKEVLRHSDYDFDGEAVIMAGNNANAIFHLHYYKGKFAARQRTYIIRPSQNWIPTRFLYYLLRRLQPHFVAQSQGTTTKFVTIGMLRDAPVKVPPKDKIEQITDTLGALDDKIELNRQINQTLEQIAQAIFKSWFIDFEPVKAKIQAKQNGQDPERAAMRVISGKTDEELDQLSPEQRQQLTSTAALFPDELEASELGEIPKGWEWSTIGDEVDVVGGGTPSTKNEEFWAGGEVNWTSPKDLSGLQDKILLKTEKKITEAGLAKISSGLLPVDTVLMSSRAPVGYLAQAKIPVAINQGYIAMKCNKRLPPEFVLLWADSVMDEIKQRASGSTFAEISKKNFKPINVVVPGKDVLEKFLVNTKTIYDKITESVAESSSLSEIRDSLLPKLLSGKIEV